MTQGHTARQGQRGTGPGRACFLIINVPVKTEKRACPFQAEVRQAAVRDSQGRGWSQVTEKAFSLQKLSTTPGKQQAGPRVLRESSFCHAAIRQSLKCLPSCPSPIPALSSGPGPPAPRSSHVRPSLSPLGLRGPEGSSAPGEGKPRTKEEEAAGARKGCLEEHGA